MVYTPYNLIIELGLVQLQHVPLKVWVSSVAGQHWSSESICPSVCDVHALHNTKDRLWAWCSQQSFIQTLGHIDFPPLHHNKVDIWGLDGDAEKLLKRQPCNLSDKLMILSGGSTITRLVTPNSLPFPLTLSESESVWIDIFNFCSMKGRKLRVSEVFLEAPSEWTDLLF